MKICIVGAGAIGGWIGMLLGQAPDVELSAVARGATLQALREHGLQLTDVRGTHRLSLRAEDDPSRLGPQDLVVIAVKAPALAEVSRRIAPLLGPDTMVLTAMNGVPWWFLQGRPGTLADQPLRSVDPQGDIARAIPARHVIGCVVHASCALLAPGHVKHHFGNGLIVGEPSGQSTSRLQSLVQRLTQAGFQTTLSPHIQKDTWYKLWGNMTVNPVSAMTGATTDLILDDPQVRGFISQVMLEAKAIGAELGIAIDQNPEDRHAVTRKLGAFKSSMLQDAEAGRAVELDALVGAVLELGELTGIETPFTQALMGLSRLHSRVHGLYPPAAPQA